MAKSFENIKKKILKSQENFGDELDAVADKIEAGVIETKSTAVQGADLTPVTIGEDPDFDPYYYGGTVSSADSYPIVKIGGVDVELKPLNAVEISNIVNGYQGHYKYMFSDMVSPGCVHSKYRTHEIKEVGDRFKMYGALVNGVYLIVSTGSKVIAKTLGTDYRNKNAVLILTASNLETEALTVKGHNSVNNSRVSGANHYDFHDSHIRASNIYTRDNGYVRLTKSVIGESAFYSSQGIILNDSSVSGMMLNHVHQIYIEQTKFYPSGTEAFSYNIYQPNTEVSIRIVGIRLSKFDSNDVQAIYGKETRDRYTLTIQRRIDYGYFSALKPLPFIRVGNDDIMVAGELFKATEFLYTPITVNPTPPQIGSAWGGSLQPMTSYGAVDSRAAVRSRIGVLVFGPDYAKQAESNIHRDLIDGVYDQIRSRVSLYANLNALQINSAVL